MGLGSVVRNAVATVDKVLGEPSKDGLKSTFRLYAWISDDEYNKSVYASPVNVTAFIEEKERSVRISTGEEVWQKATITITRPLKPNGASGRKEPIDVRDKIVLPSGYTGPIKDAFGETDPSTNRPYMLTVILG